MANTFTDTCTINISSLRDADCFYCYVFYKYLIPMGSGKNSIVRKTIKIYKGDYKNDTI